MGAFAAGMEACATSLDRASDALNIVVNPFNRVDHNLATFDREELGDVPHEVIVEIRFARPKWSTRRVLCRPHRHPAPLSHR